MDPLSITASVVGLTASCLQTAKRLSDLKDKFDNASMTIAAICTETTIISASLSRIQSSMLSDPNTLSEKLSARPDLEAVLDQSFTGCYVIFDVLQAEVQKLTEGVEQQASEPSFLAKLRYLWNEKTMQDILTQIRGIQSALTLLLQLLGTDTLADLKHMLDNNTTVLSQVAERTARLRSSKLSRAPQSIFDMSFTTESIYSGDGASMISTTRFAFDNEVVNAQAYRRALVKAYSRSNDEGNSQQVVIDNREDESEEEGSIKTQQRPEQGSFLPDRPVDSIATEAHTEPFNQDDTSPQQNLSTIVLGPTPKDALMEFLFDPPSMTDWVTFSKLDRQDLDEISAMERHRYDTLHELILSEEVYLQQLQLLRYLYKYRLTLDLSINNLTLKTRSQMFPGCEDIYHANKTLLFDPLKSLRLSEGPWLSSFWDIFQNWLTQAGDFYVEYTSNLPMLNVALQKEAKMNALFSQFLEQSRRHPLSNRLEWASFLKSPVLRIQRYSLLLSTVLRNSDRQEPRHKYEELEQLLHDIHAVIKRCDKAASESNRRSDIDNLRSRISKGSENILPDDTILQLSRTMLYREGRSRNMTNVVVLVFQKPYQCIKILKEVPNAKSLGEPSLEVLRVLREGISVSSQQEKKDGPRQYQVKLSAFDIRPQGTPMTLLTSDLFGAEELCKAVLAIGGHQATKM